VNQKPPLPPPRRQQGESLAEYIRRLESLGYKVVGLEWVPKDPRLLPFRRPPQK
jgi:hypothetical protein